MDMNQVWLRFRKALVLTTLVLCCLSPAWSDAKLSSPSAQDSKKVCYCGCDSKIEVAACTKMCELPKFQGHWWAKNCQARPAAKVRAPAQPTPHATSKKNNRVQSASL
jgi:hypothetical protein